MTTEDFIEKAKKIYGSKYSYEDTDIGCITEKRHICITCPKHGHFFKTINKFLYCKQGCPKCSEENKRLKITMANEQFIERAREVHGNKYDYSKVDMFNRDEKGRVCIICPEHGEFWQQPQRHLAGTGCKYCVHRSFSYTTEEWVKKAREIHDNKYDYSLTNYVNKKTPVTIICQIHGKFLQLPENHLKGCGCAKCGGVEKLTTEQFIEKAHKVHHDRYDYSKTEYVGANTNVCIICHKKDKDGNEHGEFWQTPTNHTHKTNPEGCPKCRMSKGEEKISNLLTEKKIKFIYNANKRSLKWIGQQHIDFYLQEYNVGIEYQGEQHSKPISFGGTTPFIAENNLKDNIVRDKRKAILCEKNNFPLFYINYKENIEEKLNNILNSIQNGRK